MSVYAPSGDCMCTNLCMNPQGAPSNKTSHKNMLYCNTVNMDLSNLDGIAKFIKNVKRLGVPRFALLRHQL